MDANEMRRRFEHEVRTQFAPLLDRLEEFGAESAEIEMIVTALGHQIVFSFLDNAIRNTVSAADGFRIETAQLRRSVRNAHAWEIEVIGLNGDRQTICGRGATIVEALFDLHAQAGTLRPININFDDGWRGVYEKSDDENLGL